MPIAISSPEIDIALGDSPENVSQKYNLPLEKVQEYKAELLRLLDTDDETFEKFMSTNPLSNPKL